MVTFDICKGNPGALTFVMLAYEYNPYRAEAAFRRMQNNGITGDKLYMLWNDCCDRDVEQALVNMECMSMEEIVSHINYEGGRGIPIPKKENLWWLRSPHPSQMGGEQIDETGRITRNPYLLYIKHSPPALAVGSENRGRNLQDFAVRGAISYYILYHNARIKSR